MNEFDSQKDQNSDPTPNLEGSNLYDRITRLSEMLSIISFHLSESNAAARASSIIKTCISLNTINFDVMKTVTNFMIEVDACNIFLTSQEIRMPQSEINTAKELADDILADMPFEFRIVDDAPKDSVNSIGVINASMDDMEDVIIIGTIASFRRILTRNNELMAIIKIGGTALEAEIVAFPRTFAKYRDLLENQPTNIKRVFTCDLQDGQYILKEIKDVEVPMPSAFEDLVEDLFSDFPEEQYKDWVESSVQIEDEEIKILVFRYGRACRLRNAVNVESRFYQQQDERCKELLQEIRNLGISYDDLRNKWQAYFEEGEASYANYGFLDANLPDVTSLIQQMESESDD